MMHVRCVPREVLSRRTVGILTLSSNFVYGKHFQQSMDRPSMFANPARGQLDRKTEYPLSPYAPENSVSRDGFGRPFPRQEEPAHSLYSG